MIEQARKLYDQAQANYSNLKAQIEAQVVRWFWASGGVKTLQKILTISINMG